MRSFKEVVKSIDHAERDVDKVLKAARLDRHESRMTDQRLEMILNYVMGIVLVMCCSGLFAFWFWIMANARR